MASIRCGNCQQIHSSVAQVRNCYSVTTAPAVMALHTVRGDVAVPVLDTRPIDVEPKPAKETLYNIVNNATEKQIEFITTLGKDRDYAKLEGQKIKADGLEYSAMRLYRNIAVEGAPTSKKVASALIDAMLDLPYTKRTVTKSEKFENVPDGRYAIDNASGKGDTVFYKVWTRRDGSRGVDLQVSEDFISVRRSDVEGILKRIEKDVEGALARYGKEIGACGICGRTLTNEASRERGIGDRCASKLGY